MEEFTIDPEFFVSVPVKFTYTENDVKYEITTSVDHPSFAAMRDHLDHRGFIKIEHGWCNGDKVVKDFKLNGKEFIALDKFVSAGAMKYKYK